MKNCPFCAEQIRSDAVKCKHCHSELPASPLQTKNSQSLFDSWLIKGLLISIAAIAYFSILFFKPVMAFFVALFVIWWFNYQNKESIMIRLRSCKQHKLRLVLSVLAVGISLFANYVASYPAPSLEIVSNVSDQGQNTSYTLQVHTENVTYLIVNGKKITENDDGIFNTAVELPTTKTTINIQASNGVKTAKTSVTIERQQTEEELAKAEAIREKEEAEQKAWEATEAGQICLRHSTWSKEDCQSIADDEYWIGMSIGMLKELRGTPNSASPSNYGNGMEWQWCWWDKTPNCFYDRDNDGLIDSYN